MEGVSERQERELNAAVRSYYLNRKHINGVGPRPVEEIATDLGADDVLERAHAVWLTHVGASL